VVELGPGWTEMGLSVVGHGVSFTMRKSNSVSDKIKAYRYMSQKMRFMHWVSTLSTCGPSAEPQQ